MSKKGFTLIELIIVIGIIGIITSVVSVGYLEYRKTSQLDLTAQKIVSTLREAQSRSVAAEDNQSYGVYFQDNAGADDQFFLFSGANYVSGTVIETYTVPSVLGLSTISFAGVPVTEVVFDKLTGTTAKYGSVTVELADTGSSKEVSISSEGRIGLYNLSETGIPSSFSLVSPTSGSSASSLNEDFDWDEPEGGADSYTLWHSTDPNFSTYTEVTGITNSFYTLGTGEELVDNARNYWKVKAVGPGGERWCTQQDWFVLTGVNAAPEDFYLLSPADSASEVTTIVPTFDWEDTTDPDGNPLTYTLEHDTDSNFTSPTSITGISLSEYTLNSSNALANHTTNYWRVIADDGLTGGQTIATDEDSGNPYRSIVVDVNLAPDPFNLLDPVGGGFANTTTPTLDWEDAIDPDTPYTGDTVSYMLWYSTDPTFSSKTEVAGLSASEYTIPGGQLVEAQTYYWRVKAEDNHGAATWSNQEDWSFYTNRAPDAFDLISPADGSSQSNDVDFNWNDTTDPDTGDTVTYHIQVDDDISFSSPEVDVSGLTNSDYTALGLSGGTYYWRVEAVDNHGYGRWSNQTWTFSISTCDWHVDQAASSGGDGLSWASAFQEIGDAVDVLGGGDRVCIADGYYEEDVRLDSSHSGSPGDYTTFINKEGDTKVFVYNRYYSFRLDDTDYVEVSGINMDPRSDGYGFYLRYGSSNNKFHDLTIEDANYGVRMYQGSSNNYNELYNIEMWGLSRRGIYDQESVGNVYHDIIVRDSLSAQGFDAQNSEKNQVYDCEFYNLERAINDEDGVRNIYRNNVSRDTSDTYGNRFVDGQELQIYENDFYNHDYTIREDGGQGNVYHRNRIHDSNKGYRYGIYSRNGVKNKFYQNEIYGHSRAIYSYRDKGNEIYDNNVYKNDAYNYLYYPYDVKVYNNVFDYHGSWAMYIRDSENLSFHHNLLSNNRYNFYSYRSRGGNMIYNNTIYGDGSGYGIYLYRFNGSTTLRNNITTNNYYGYYVGNGNSNLDSDYNDYWGNTYDFGGDGSTYRGANSIYQDPRFITPGSNFRLQLFSPCIDRGDPDPFYNDPDGSRSDIGAYPYQ